MVRKLSIKKDFVLNKHRKILIMISTLAIFVGCSNSNSDYRINRVNQETLKKISNTSIFLGHQSVGANMLSGITLIADELNYEIKITSLDQIKDSENRGIIESFIGTNKNPIDKIGHFYRITEKELSGNIDIAGMKFCYVDTWADLTARELYNEYMATMKKLEGKYSDTQFIYITIPLTVKENDLLSLLKKLLGKPISGVDGNLKRYEFNTLLRNNKSITKRVFDIAYFESTYPDGKREVYKKNSSEYEALVPLYTDDGGHLNQYGQKRIAEEFILFINNLTGN